MAIILLVEDDLLNREMIGRYLTIQGFEIITAVAAAFDIPDTTVRCGRGGLPRMLAAWLGCYEAMITNAEIAAALRLRSDKQVTNLVRQCERAFSANSILSAAADACLSTLGGETTNYSPDPKPTTSS